MSGWYVPILGTAQGLVNAVVNLITGTTTDGNLSDIPTVDNCPLLGSLTQAAKVDDTNTAFGVVAKDLVELNNKVTELRDVLISAGIMSTST